MTKYIIGIDEVGRGALAGPVVVAAALIKNVAPMKVGIRGARFGGLRDSKKLSAKQREASYRSFREDPAIDFAAARIYPRRIERMNISRAANAAARRALKMLVAKREAAAHARIFLDGGLFLGNGRQPKRARTIVKGDEKIPAIAIASIVAKVTRDRFMVRLAKRYPQYGFAAHKGYGTAKHYAALRKCGPCDAHRKTFLRSMRTS